MKILPTENDTEIIITTGTMTTHIMNILVLGINKKIKNKSRLSLKKLNRPKPKTLSLPSLNQNQSQNSHLLITHLCTTFLNTTEQLIILLLILNQCTTLLYMMTIIWQTYTSTMTTMAILPLSIT